MISETINTFCESSMNLEGDAETGTISCLANRNFDYGNIKIFSVRLKEFSKPDMKFSALR